MSGEDWGIDDFWKALRLTCRRRRLLGTPKASKSHTNSFCTSRVEAKAWRRGSFGLPRGKLVRCWA